LGGSASADCYRIDPTTLLQDVEFQTPTWRDLKGATTSEAKSFASRRTKYFFIQRQTRYDCSPSGAYIYSRSGYYGSSPSNPYPVRKVPRI